MAWTTGLCMVLSICITDTLAKCGDVEGCFCFENIASCNSPDRFPTTLPREITTLSIADMRTPNIPTEALSGLPFLKNLEIHSSTIETISTGAFKGIAGLDYFGFYKNVVDTIESYAFADMRDIGTLSMHFCTIKEIESYAFYNLQTFDDININSMNITTIRNHAFNNLYNVKRFQLYMNNIGDMEARSISNIVSLTSFEMYLNHFGRFGCGNIEHLSGKTLTWFYSNSISCNCGLTWVIGNEVLGADMYSNWCEMPGTSERFNLNELRLEHLSCTKNSHNGCPDEITTKNTFAGRLADTDILQDMTTRVHDSIELSTDNVIMTIPDRHLYHDAGIETEVMSYTTNTETPVKHLTEDFSREIAATRGEKSSDEPTFNHLFTTGMGSRKSISDITRPTLYKEVTKSPYDMTSTNRWSTKHTSRSKLYKGTKSPHGVSTTHRGLTSDTTRSKLYKEVTNSPHGGSTTDTASNAILESVVDIYAHMTDGLVPLAVNTSLNIHNNNIVSDTTPEVAKDFATGIDRTTRSIPEQIHSFNSNNNSSSRIPIYASLMFLSVFISLLYMCSVVNY